MKLDSSTEKSIGAGNEDFDRRAMLTLAGVAGAAAALNAGGRIDMAAAQTRPSAIVLMSGVELTNAIQMKQVSCVEVMNAYLDHVARINPRVNAIVALQDRGDLLAQARARDEQLARGERLGWMHGFPQAIKDLTPAKGIPATQGSPLLRTFIPTADAIIVERMKRAGCIVIGKTNVPEFGMGSHTYNSVYGTTLNAYDQTKTAGGSTGGGAVSLALRMLPVCDGTDYGGSLRNPGAFNNVFGLRPSHGRVPNEGVDTFAPSISVLGPMARNASDLAMLLSVQAGYDPRAPLSIREDPAQFTGSLRRDFKGARIAWIGDWDGYLPFDDGVLELCRAALRTFETLGCRIEDAHPDFAPDRIWTSFTRIRAFQSGAPLRVFYSDPAKRALMNEQAQFEVESFLKLSAADLVEAQATRAAWYQAVRRFFERYDFFAMPSSQVFPFDAKLKWPAEIAGRKMETYHRWMEGVALVSMSGCPAVNVPAGFNARGLPMGMQIVGPNQAEFALLQLAAAYDEATGWVEKRKTALLGA
jgi:amidase